MSAPLAASPTFPFSGAAETPIKLGMGDEFTFKRDGLGLAPVQPYFFRVIVHGIISPAQVEEFALLGLFQCFFRRVGKDDAGLDARVRDRNFKLRHKRLPVGAASRQDSLARP